MSLPGRIATCHGIVASLRHHSAGVALLDASTASLSAPMLPWSPACPFTHSNFVVTRSRSRSSILLKIPSIRSLFSTNLPPAVRQLFRRQFWNQLVKQSMEYFESVMMTMSRWRGTVSIARCTAVSSALWFVWRTPVNGSEIFLLCKLTDALAHAMAEDQPVVSRSKPDANTRNRPFLTILQRTSVCVNSDGSRLINV